MKDLKEIMLEAIDASLKQKLIDIINSDILDDKTARKMLNTASVMSPELQKKIDDMMAQKGISDVTKMISRILKEYDEFDLLANIANGEFPLISEEEFINGTNIYDLIHRKYPTIEKACLEELAALQPSKNSITRGLFEIIVQLFLADVANDNNSKNSSGGGHGDVNTNSYTIEFKTPGARVKSQKERTAKDIDIYIEKYLKNKHIKLKDLNLQESKGGIFHSQRSINEFFNALSLENFTDDELFNLIAKAILAMYENPTDLNKRNYKFPFDENKIIASIVNNGKVNAKNVIRLMGCIQLMYYATEEGYTHFCIFYGKQGEKAGEKAVASGKYKCFTGDYVRNIDLTFYDKTLAFSAGGKYDGASRENYCCINFV